MTSEAGKHLAKAREYVARGEEFYRKAAEEIIAAQKADPTLSNREIGEWFGKSEFWVRDVVLRVTNASVRSELYEARNEASARAVAKSVLREADPETLAAIVGDLPTERRAAIVRAAVPPPQRSERETSGPTFIELIVRVSGALIELESMVAGWQNRAAVPAEFSRESFNDIVAKVLRIQDHFDGIADIEDDDEFQRIVRNFRVVADVR